ncbi:unnamed protein product [Linum tenue]|uniref:Zinc finger PHD-type domain-containing protein n=1 Tax=Linum tenue TaxID=586396 RepID=A0AAV0J0U9_9ROSI|nr:unnamed protein product [Linum tenue]
MDLVNSCKDLVDRILNVLHDAQGSKAWPKRGVLGRDEAAKLVDDIYRKMQVSGTDLASKAQCVLDSSNSNPKVVKGEPEDSFHRDTKVRCPCGSSLETESMIKCEDPRCQVWQHIGCVIVAEKPMEGSPQVPEVFYCVPVRAINRPGSQLLGANGRDDGPIITPCTKDGINKYRSGFDARVFCLGVRIVKRRTLQSLMVNNLKTHFLVFAVVLVWTPTDGADSDSDLEVVADSITVNLRCPWQCPICLKNYSLDSVIVDPFFNRITTKMRHCGEDVTEIEHTKWGGSVKGGGNREASQAGRNNRLQPDNFQQKVIPMTSSGTGSGEDPSVNQDAISAPVAADAAEIIVLSDTDMKNDILVSSGAGFNNNQNDVGAGWIAPRPPPQGGPGFQLFSSDVSDPLVDLHHGPTSINGYSLVLILAWDMSIWSHQILQWVDLTGMVGWLIIHWLSRKILLYNCFFPTRPLDSSMHSNREIIIRSMHRRIMVGFDLRIGSLLGWEVVLPAAGGGHGESVPLANGSLTSRHAMPTNRDGAMGSLTDTGAEMPCLSLSRFIFFLETGFFFFFICDAKFLWA